MEEEIKEILENIKKCCDIMKVNNFVVYQKQDILKLLDYITNLQQENEKLDYAHAIDESWYRELYEDYKSRNEKAIEYLGINEEILETCEIYDVNGIEVYKILQGSEKE